jgi:hypothetical protein
MDGQMNKVDIKKLGIINKETPDFSFLKKLDRSRKQMIKELMVRVYGEPKTEKK